MQQRSDKMSKPTIVFVHGAWHHPDYFEPLSKVLQNHGYETRSVALPSVVEAGVEPLDGPQDDMNAARKVIQGTLDAGSNVLVVPHSYGGIPTTGAVKGLDAKSRAAEGHNSHVIGIAAISAVVHREGETAPSGCGAPRGEMPDVYAIVGPLNIPRAEEQHRTFYNHLSADEAAPWLAKLRPMSRKALWANESGFSAHKVFPIHYLHCSDDNALTPAQQRMIIDNLKNDGGSVRIEEINADHSPFLSAVERTSDFLRRSAGEQLPE